MIPLTLGKLDVDSNEHWLFHGSSQAGVEGIAQGDFRLELAGTHRGTMYGNGVYFAECSSKADEYAYEEEGLCRMLLCRVVLGRMLIDQSARPATAGVVLAANFPNAVAAILRKGLRSSFRQIFSAGTTNDVRAANSIEIR
jgi:hypothetical protein